MSFDIYSLIQSKEVRKFLRKERKLTLLEKLDVIMHSYFPIDRKLTFMQELLAEAPKEQNELAREEVALFEFVVNYIRHPGAPVLYMSLENRNGYYLTDCRNDYELSRGIIPDTHYFTDFKELIKFWNPKNESFFQPGYRVCVDMVCMSEPKEKDNEVVQTIWFYLDYFEGGSQILYFGINEKWFKKQGFSEECLDSFTYGPAWHFPLPFENGCRIRLKTPDMDKPVYGIIDSSEDFSGCWYHFLNCEDETHDAKALRILLDEG